MAFIGEAFLSASLQVIMEKLASPIIKEFKFRWGVDNEVKRLGMMLAQIQAVLDDAEQREIRENSVKMWLNHLKDVAYDIDDVMDEFAYEIERFKLKDEADTNQVWSIIISSINTNINAISFRLMIASKIKDLIKRLEELEGMRVMLGFTEGVGGSRLEIRERLTTSSVVDEFDFVGRVDDIEKIIELLLWDNPNNGNDVSVIPILGMGGNGKTTLVQAVYNDKRVNEYFEMKAWVCVSQEFDVRRLTQAILESATMWKYDLEYLDALQVSLKDRLRGKRFLLVLDDVWTEKQDDWDVLRAPFGVGAPGSKILVTTRNQKVSLITGTIPPYDLGGLPNEDCWSLFKQRAFTGGNSSASENLKIIGKEIVKKCKGSPLAVKTLGGLLRSNEDVEKWEYVLNTEIWDLPAGNDHILSVLRLSYHHLPSFLKQCFAYCSIFPKDFEIQKEVLVRLWIAEGFLQPDGRRCLEDIGNEYFDDLFLRSFFQHSNRQKRYFVMHDLVHDLTQSISGEICCRLENCLSDNITERTRHLSLFPSDNVGNLELFYKAKRLRTIFTLWGTALQPSYDFFEKLKYLRVLRLVTDSIIDIPNSVYNLKHLRYLDLSCDGIIQTESIGRLLNLQILILKHCIELPNSIGNLKQLRHLELSNADIERLPESIASLFNLQALILDQCSKIRELPKDIKNLIGLRILDIVGCVALISLPLGFGKLTNIQNFPWFPLSRESGAKFGELKDLNKLSGSCHIKGLENVITANEAKEADLKNKQYLQVLWLQWDKGDHNMRGPSVEELVLENLQPHTNLEELNIVGSYGGARFPKWMEDRSFSRLKSITLQGGGECCQVLPALGQLPSLIDLKISKVPGLKHMGREFYGMGKGFPSLETLYLKDLPELEEWFGVEEDDEFLCLRKLTIIKCPKLRKLPDTFPTLTKLTIKSCKGLVVLPRLPALCDLTLVYCDDMILKSMPYLNSPSYLHISGFKESTAFPEEFMGALLLIPHPAASAPLTEISRRFLSTMLKCLKISHCSNLELLSLQDFMSLKTLEIIDCPKLVSFHDEWLPTTLKDLHIDGCPLKHLPKGLQNLLSLETLEIWNCYILESLPEDGLPTALRHLTIYACKLLQRRCREGGEDWLKISHIPERHIGPIF